MDNILNNPKIKMILNDVKNNNWNTDYAVRYIVVNISRLVRHDPVFYLSSNKEKIEMFRDGNYKKDFPNIICKTLHELIRDILATIGIKSKVVVATNAALPLYALIVEGENNRYFVDALYDLFRAQYDIQPVTYGSHIRSKSNILDEKALKLESLPLDYIREMDIDTGIINQEYFSDYINKIKNDFTNRNKAKEFFGVDNSVDLIEKKVEYISNSYLNLYSMDGPIERTALHVFFRNNLYNKSEKSNFYIGNRIDKENNPVYIIIKYGTRVFTFEEVYENNKYSLVETMDVITPRTF